MNKFVEFLNKNNIKPNNIKLYSEAFTHSTFCNEKKTKINNYQKMEFLGDAVLGKLITEYIYMKYKNMNEGQMTMLKASVINGDSLFYFSKKLGFDNFIKFGHTKEDLKNNKNILEDVFESFIAALYLDLGENEVKKLLRKTIFNKIDKLSNQNLKNPKTILQEYLQSESRGVIKYNSITTNSVCKTTIIFDGNVFGKGKGKNKKEAEVNAAINALEKVGVK